MQARPAATWVALVKLLCRVAQDIGYGVCEGQKSRAQSLEKVLKCIVVVEVLDLASSPYTFIEYHPTGKEGGIHRRYKAMPAHIWQRFGQLRVRQDISRSHQELPFSGMLFITVLRTASSSQP